MDRIELNPSVCNGKPVNKGTRILVSVIPDQIAEGESWSKPGLVEALKAMITGQPASQKLLIWLR